MGDRYDPNERESYLILLDAVGLYASVNRWPLGTGGFEWLTREEINDLDIQNLDDEGPIGYVFEVKLAYPNDLHSKHSAYPLAVESMVVRDEQLSPLTRNLKAALGLNCPPVKKLVPNLNNKDHYVTHYRNLKFYMSQGLILERIYRGMKFRQSCWLAPFIDLNFSLRKMAKDEASKNLFKLMNNSIFGKTLENRRKHRVVKLLNGAGRVRTLVSKPNFKSFRIFSDSLVGVEMRPISVALDKPIYIGFSSLELSKLHMGKFYYDFLLREYPGKISLLLSDTDSLLLRVFDISPYEIIGKNPEKFDTSNYPTTHPLFSLENKKKPLTFSDELGGRILTSYIGLRPKLYSLMYNDFNGDVCFKKTAKGVKRCMKDKHLTHDLYKRALFDNEKIYVDMKIIRSIDHKLYTQNVRKLALCSYDDKIYQLNFCETRAIGHCLNV